MFNLSVALLLPALSLAQQIAIGTFPSSAAVPAGQITEGPDGALWFTQSGGESPAYIGRLTAAGASTGFLVPTANASPGGLPQGQMARCGLLSQPATRSGASQPPA
jgi:streptogramin lyase